MRKLLLSSLVLGLASSTYVACGDDVKTVPATQITARLYIAGDVRGQLATLHVQSASQSGAKWQVISNQSYTAAEISELQPLDIGFIPKPGTKHDKQVELVFEARNAAGTPIAQERALVGFVPQKQRLLELWLDTCGGTAVCETTRDCHGPSCAACVSGECGSTRSYADDALLPLDPNVDPDPNKPAPSGPPVTAVTCAVSTKITCDDGNPCNGLETCDPGRNGAKANGCALVRPAIECGASSICLQDSGRCATCAEQSDGDEDGSASMACGGNDCNDNDGQISPSKLESCDGKDNDCNGTVDDAAAANADCAARAEPGVTATCNAGRCEQSNQKVTLRFRAKVGNAPFECGRSYPGLGSGTDAATPHDFRFFVQEVSLLNAQGMAFPVTLDVRPPWQSAAVALIDFTNGAGSCVGGATTNVEVTGTVAPGTYTGVELVNGVPEPLNHAEPVAPLTADTFRGAVAGYRFVSAALASSAGPSGMDDAGVRDGGAGDGGASPAPADAGGSVSAVHLGSSGCTASGCMRTNRNRVRLPSFDPATQVVVADLAKVFAGIDLAQALQCDVNPPAACTPGYAALGVGADGMPTTMQSVFSVERAD